MTVRSMARWLLVSVLCLDALFAVLLFTGGLSGLTVAEPAAAEPSTEIESTPSTEALRLLGSQLAERAAELERRESELDELLRGSEVLRRAGLLPEPERQADPAPGTAAPAAAESAPRASAAFQSLQRAYENMEPESAARAVAELAGRDKDAVVQLLLGWKPRTSGAILDALTQTNPALAADLSYEIWKLDGKRGG